MKLLFLRRFSICMSLSFMCLSSGQALEYKFGDYHAQLSTKLTLGVAWRMEDRDQRQLSQANLGVPYGSNIGSPNNNADDGNWNFDKSETYSKIIKGSSEFSVGNQDVGLVTGLRYFYDFELKDEARAKDHTGYSRSLSSETLEAAGSDVELMNAYLYGSFDVGRPFTVKAGRQRLMWGEGLFMQGGVNVINHADLSAARVPGAELKEILLPVNMLSASYEISDNLSLAAFYQLEWQPIEIDPCGSFFSFNDAVTDGCGPIMLVNIPDSESAARIASSSDYIPRLDDREASDSGQFGVALRWYLKQLNGSELGFYYLNYHSRLPYFSGVVLDPYQVTPSARLPVLQRPSYYVEYPEDIRLYGLSLSNTTDAGYSFAAEYSFRENLPVQWNSGEVIHGGLLRLYSRHLQQRILDAGLSDPLDLAGQDQKGYDRFKVSQLQLSTIKLFNDVMDANQMTFAAEVGAVYVHSLPDQSTARYGRADAFGNGDLSGLGQTVFDDIFEPFVPTTYSCTGEGAIEAINSNPTYCDSQGYTTQFSWGYLLLMQWAYQAVFANVSLQPEVFFSHDVNGYSPNPMGLFVEGRKSLGLTLNADYLLGRYQASLGYVHYYGGGRDNLLNDRDHLSASISVAF